VLVGWLGVAPISVFIFAFACYIVILLNSATPQSYNIPLSKYAINVCNLKKKAKSKKEN
jgi:hypothetical protein